MSQLDHDCTGIKLAMRAAWRGHFFAAHQPPQRFILGLDACKQLMHESRPFDEDGVELLHAPYKFRNVRIEVDSEIGQEHRADMVGLDGKTVSIWPTA